MYEFNAPLACEEEEIVSVMTFLKTILNKINTINKHHIAIKSYLDKQKKEENRVEKRIKYSKEYNHKHK